MKFGMVGCKPVGSPALKDKLSPSYGPLLVDPTQYRSLVGAFQYVTLTRPDISFAVNQTCQYMHSPTEVHLAAAKRILRFLKGIVAYGLHFRPGPLRLHAYCDA